MLLTVGSDGWFRIYTDRIDSAWFFMSGKSWMEGLTPYVDFTDSKGPLLWLIYGVGYLISPTNFYGIFIFEWICYSLTFIVLFKAARLFSCNSSQAMLASMLMALLFFYPGMHQENRIEDFCHLFQALVFYILIQSIYCRRFNNKYAVGLGICLGATLMMKYVYTLTLSIPTLFIATYLLKKNIFKVKYLLYFAAGFAIIVAPILIYFAIEGALQTFIQEYFLNTGNTILVIKDITDVKAENIENRWPFNIKFLYTMKHFRSGFMLIVLCGLLLSILKLRRSRWVSAAIATWYVVCILLFSLVSSYPYYISLSIFAFGGVAVLCGFIKRIDFSGCIIAGASILAVMTIFSTRYIYHELFYYGRDVQAIQTKKIIAYYINKKELTLNRNPKLVYYMCGSEGEDIGTHAIAGTRYWSKQYGMTSEMLKQHREDVSLYRPDFVIIEGLSDSYIEGLGYTPVVIYSPLPHLPNQKPFIRTLYEWPESKL